MKRKTFQKRLMAVGIQRNEAGALSREICKTMYERGNPSALGVCLVAHIMRPLNPPISAAESYYAASHASLFFVAKWPRREKSCCVRRGVDVYPRRRRDKRERPVL